jgi:hypothetical protein
MICLMLLSLQGNQVLLTQNGAEKRTAFAGPAAGPALWAATAAGWCPRKAPAATSTPPAREAGAAADSRSATCTSAHRQGISRTSTATTTQVPPLKPVGYTWSFLACKTGHLVPIWQPLIGPSFHFCSSLFRHNRIYDVGSEGPVPT